MSDMGRIAVFDSGLGSLSIILAIRKAIKADLIYFADQKHYPYGTKNEKKLRQIIESTIDLLQSNFKPDMIVVGSNTPTVLFPDVFKNKTVVGVFPPLCDAIKKTKTKSIAILGTLGTINSINLQKYIQDNVSKHIRVIKIDATELIDLVESGKFLTDQSFCIKKIKKMLCDSFIKNNVDVATLSSTHLPFLYSMLQKIFPQITFLDPADNIVRQIIKQKNIFPSKRNSMKIFTSGDISKLQHNLQKLKIKNRVTQLQFD